MATNGLANVANLRTEPEEPLKADLIKAYLLKTYPDEETRIQQLTDDQALLAANNMLQIITDHSERFQRGDKLANLANHAVRVRGKLQGKIAKDVAKLQGVPEARVGDSYRYISSLASEFLPLPVLLGEQEFPAVAPEAEDEPPGKEHAGSEKLRALALRGEVAPSPFKDLFTKDEMRILTLLCYGVKIFSLPRLLGIEFDDVRKHRINLSIKFGLTHNPQSVAPLLHEVVVCGVVPLFEELEPATTPLSDRELEVYRLAAQGKDNEEIGKKLSLKVKAVSDYKTKAHNKLKPAGIYAYSGALLALGRGIIPPKTTKEKLAFAKELKKINEENKTAFDKNWTPTIEELTDGEVVGETDEHGRPVYQPDGRQFDVRKLHGYVLPKRGSADGSATPEAEASGTYSNLVPTSEVEEIPKDFEEDL